MTRNFWKVPLTTIGEKHGQIQKPDVSESPTAQRIQVIEGPIFVQNATGRKKFKFPIRNDVSRDY